MKPSDFLEFPSASIARKYESEQVALNIMVILERTKNKFRKLSWREYKAQRLIDGHFTEGEKSHFDKVIGFCLSANTAVLFSPEWAKK